VTGAQRRDDAITVAGDHRHVTERYDPARVFGRATLRH
jgi:hypothetical protein